MISTNEKKLLVERAIPYPVSKKRTRPNDRIPSSSPIILLFSPGFLGL